MYFAARDLTGLLCVGAARSVSGSPIGPFQDRGAPLVRNTTIGSIDPSFYIDRTVPYVLWKSDGNAIGKPCVIYAQPVTSNGLDFLPNSLPKPLLSSGLAWEYGVLEAPWIWKQGSS